MTEEHKDSQQEPNQDSGLQTPQPDQPMPTEAERAEENSDDVRVTRTTEIVEESNGDSE